MDRKPSMFLAVAILVLALASGGSAEPFNPKVNPKRSQGERCALSAKTADGTAGFKRVELCITEGGNVKIYGVKGTSKFIQDAYWICHTQNFLRSVVAIDPGPGPGEGFEPNGTVEQPGGAGTFPLIITRTTEDPKFLLRQEFQQESGVQLDLRVEMTLQYLGPADAVSGVTLVRQFDRERPYVNPRVNQLTFENSVEALQTGRVSATTDSVFGWNEGIWYGLMLSTPQTDTFQDGDTTHAVGARPGGVAETTSQTCGPSSLGSSVGPGDGRGRVVFEMGTMYPPPGGTVGFPTSKSIELRFWLF